MRTGVGFRAAVAVAGWVAAQPVFAHPGHVHLGGPVHGYSWVDLLGIVAVVAVAVVLAWVRRRRGVRHED